MIQNEGAEGAPGNGGAAETDEVRIGVYVCHCGTNIAKVVDVAGVAEAAGNQPCVAVARHGSWWPPAAPSCTSRPSARPVRKPG
jgi:hypothetical protein